MKICSLFFFILLFSFSSTIYAAKSGCETKLLMTEQRMDEISQELATKIRQSKAKVRDGKYTGGTSPDEAAVKEMLGEYSQQIPDLSARIAHYLKGQSRNANHNIEEEAGNSAEKKEVEPTMFAHLPHFGIEGLSEESWHYHDNKIYKTQNGWRIYTKPDKMFTFTLPEKTFRAINGIEFEKKTNGTRGLFKLMGDLVLEIPEMGPMQLLRLPQISGDEAIFIDEFSHFLRNEEPNHGLDATVLSSDKFLTYANREKEAIIWQLDANNKAQQIHRVQNFNINNNGSWAIDNKVVLLQENILIQSNVSGTRIYDLKNNSVSDTFSPPSAKAKGGDIVQRLIKVDDHHFIKITFQGHVLLYKLQKSGAKNSLNFISSLANRDVMDRHNLDLRKGHLISSAQTDTIQAAALVAKDMLLTAGKDKRLVLSRFDLEGRHEVIETFPNYNPRVEDDKVVSIEGEMHKYVVDRFRYKWKNNQLWIESEELNSNILWAPMGNMFFNDEEL